MPLTGKAAIVTGAAGEIGRAFALALGGAGAAVTCVDVDGDGAADTAREVFRTGAESQALQADPAVPDDAERIAAITEAAFRRLDVFVHVAEPPPDGDLLAIDAEAFANRIGAAHAGLLLGARAAARRMIAHGAGGHILAVAAWPGADDLIAKIAADVAAHGIDATPLDASLAAEPAGIGDAILRICADGPGSTVP